MTDHNKSDHDLIIEMHAAVQDLVWLVKRGNGQPSLIARVASLELWRSMLIGAWALVVLAMGAYASWKK